VSRDPELVHLEAAHLTVEPAPGFDYPDPSVALLAFPAADRGVVLSGTVQELRDVAESILSMCDELACTCDPGGISPDCPTHGGE
jgi:hypothetical protein